MRSGEAIAVYMATPFRGIRRSGGILCLAVISTFALNRWSSLHLIPDADFLPTLDCSVASDGLETNIPASGAACYRSNEIATLGLNDRLNIDIGYAGGITGGFKAAVLTESSGAPSLAIGVRDLFHNTEDFLYAHGSPLWKGEYFIALGKDFGPLGLRLHGGVETMPDVPAENIDCFFGLEKSIDRRLYLTFESEERNGRFRPSIFANVRFFQDHGEFSLGEVNMFSNANESVKPGVWLGLRFRGGLGASGGATAAREFLNGQEKDPVVDAVREWNKKHAQPTAAARASDVGLDDNAAAAFTNRVLENLTMVATLYGQRSFDIEQVKKLKGEIASYGDAAIPVLHRLALDKFCDPRVHAQACGVLGDIGGGMAADAVLDILARTHDTDARIEACIAEGKMHDHRAIAIIQKLSGDDNDAVAFTAKSVLEQLNGTAVTTTTTIDKSNAAAK